MKRKILFNVLILGGHAAFSLRFPDVTSGCRGG